LKWPQLLRWPLRLPIFLLPGILLKSSFENQFNQIMSIHMKYNKRIINTKRTCDLRYLDPTGNLAKQF